MRFRVTVNRLRWGCVPERETFGSSVIVAAERLLYADSEVVEHDQYDLGGHS